MLANGTISRFDISLVTPILEDFANENWTLVGDDVLGFSSDSSNDSIEEIADVDGRRMLREYGKPDNKSGEMVDDHRYPPTEGPRLI